MINKNKLRKLREYERNRKINMLRYGPDFPDHPKDRAEIKAARSEMIYPPVSTEWGAAGRLMDALHKKGHKPCIMGGQDGNFAGFVYYQDEESDWARIKRVHPSGPMALVLAVNELTPIENTEK